MASDPKQDPRLAGGWGDELDALAPPAVSAGRAVLPGGRDGLPAGSNQGMAELEMPAETGPSPELDWGDRGHPEARAAAQPGLPLPDLDVGAAAATRPRSGPMAARPSAAVVAPRPAAWTPSETRPTLVIAGMGKRVMAHLVDTFALGGMTYGLWWIWYRSTLKRFEHAPPTHLTESQLDNLGVSVLGMVGVVTVISFLYYVLPTTIWGWSPGKKLMGLKVVNADGDTPSLGRVVLREVLGKWVSSMFCSIGYLMAFFDPEHRALHDRIATTTVVEE